MSELNLKTEQNIESVEDFKFEPIKGQPMLNWRGKRPFTSTQFYPAQPKESYGEEVNGWMNKIFWGDNLQVMSHLLKHYRGQVDLIYIDPPFDSKADYKKKIELRGKKAENDKTAFEEKQYTDIWSNDEYLQFMYERLILMRELLSDNGSVFLHCDWHKNHHLRSLLDEVFGPDNCRNEIVWKKYSGVKNQASQRYTTQTDSIFWYSKGTAIAFNMQYRPMSQKYIEDEYKYVDENGRRYALLRGRGYQNSDGVAKKKYLDENPGTPITSLWDDDNLQLNTSSSERIGYPTQKPESLLERIIKAHSNPEDLIFDCFMDETKYTGFEVYNVNNYDVFRNPIQAKDLLIQALELQPLPGNELYDGEKDGRMVKIMPVNRIATRVDLNELITGFPRDKFEKIKAKNPNKPVELITLVCMGHEPDLGASLKLQMKEEGYNIDVEVLDILRDKVNLEFRRDSKADVRIEGDRLVIREFYPMNLLQKLSIEETNVEEWRELVDSVKIDFNYDGAVFTPTVIDIPEGRELVKGSYEIPEESGTIKVKITDLLSESCEVTLNA